ncbi:hypothetical protein LVD15_25385 [Fulvivirga maritima]|uniref:hypothetical protein n=1 Tax=Fulvivirga maritima TaxID=2904247 RepID=UPI001F25DB4B|nr:hypothetical protein [Fulvivirga maritima]UII26589.1 hypothetical protein LVD15_25385 [Fulvivirga maritima]
MTLSPTALLTIILLGISPLASAQMSEDLTYCDMPLETPVGCNTKASEVTCDDYAVQWLYMNTLMLKSMPEQFISQMEDEFKKFSKQPIQASSFGYPLDGQKITYKHKGHWKYKIVAYGVVNAQPVMLNISLLNDPVNNDALPDFVQVMIQLKD